MSTVMLDCLFNCCIDDVTDDYDCLLAVIALKQLIVCLLTHLLCCIIRTVACVSVACVCAAAMITHCPHSPAASALGVNHWYIHAFNPVASALVGRAWLGCSGAGNS